MTVEPGQIYAVREWSAVPPVRRYIFVLYRYENSALWNCMDLLTGNREGWYASELVDSSVMEFVS